MNTGLQIRNKKLAKKRQRRTSCSPKEEKICRFIDFRNSKTARLYGKSKFLGIEFLTGLQTGIKFHYIDKYTNKLRWCYIKKQGTKVLTVYSEAEFENFDPRLVKMYHDYKAKLQEKETQKDF